MYGIAAAERLKQHQPGNRGQDGIEAQPDGHGSRPNILISFASGGQGFHPARRYTLSTQKPKNQSCPQKENVTPLQRCQVHKVGNIIERMSARGFTPPTPPPDQGDHPCPPCP
ncbi:hypothetical protein WCLP8_5150015 [uncultured Gammaproteobacteria bacterium]